MEGNVMSIHATATATATETTATATESKIKFSRDAGETRMVTFREVKIDDSFNVRQFFDDSEERALVQSIKKQGVMNPILVRRAPDGSLELVSGFRRMRALREIHGEKVGDVKVPALIKDLDIRAAYVANMAENETRSTVKRYDLATRLVYMKDRHGCKGTDLARMIGMSNATVSNLMACRVKLAREIVEYWKAAESVESEIPITILTRWASVPHDAQLVEFAAYVAKKQGKKAPTTEAPEAPKAPEATKKHDKLATLRAKTEILSTLRAMQDARDASVKGGKPWTDIQEGAIRALEWVIGERVALRTGK